MRRYRIKPATTSGDGRGEEGDNDRVETGIGTASPGARGLTTLERLRRRGERVTRARRAIVEVLDATAEHLTADEIVGAAEIIAPGVHRATVYRALATLGDLGLVTHTHIGGAAAVYHLTDLEPAATRPHAHVQCTSCHRVFDVSVEALAPMVSQLERDLGFALDPQHAALLGVCADCRPRHTTRAE
jgi:Fur family ferric uptake transcriptional regulator